MLYARFYAVPCHAMPTLCNAMLPSFPTPAMRCCPCLQLVPPNTNADDENKTKLRFMQMLLKLVSKKKTPPHACAVAVYAFGK